MSESQVRVVQLNRIEQHPNADLLSIAMVDGYPVIIRTEDFSIGDLAVYIPVDSIVPADDPQFAFLAGKTRIKARRLRNVFSMGLLVPAAPDMQIGEDVGDRLKITKYEELEPYWMGTENDRDPGFLPVYTDIEGLRKWGDLLCPGEEVVLTEKIHGANARFLYREGHLWVGSHKRIKKGTCLWTQIAEKYELEAKLAQVPHTAIYGEIYGANVQALPYGRTDHALLLFDAMDTNTRVYYDFDRFMAIAGFLGLPTVPVLYRGPWMPSLRDYAEGTSTLAAHVREGFVVRPVKERIDGRIGRVILKLPGEGYLLR